MRIDQIIDDEFEPKVLHITEGYMEGLKSRIHRNGIVQGITLGLIAGFIGGAILGTIVGAS